VTISDLEELAALAIECGFAIHRDLGPGLLESCYEVLLAASLARAGLAVERQKAVDIKYRGISVRDISRGPSRRGSPDRRSQSDRPSCSNPFEAGAAGPFMRD
jgi:hypothetical protein